MGRSASRVGDRGQGKCRPKGTAILVVEQHLDGDVLAVAVGGAQLLDGRGVGLRASKDLDISSLHLAECIASEPLESGIDVGEWLIGTVRVGNEHALSDSPQRTLPQPHRFLGPPPRGGVHERDYPTEPSAFAADRVGPILDRKAGAIAAPEYLVIDINALT